MSEILLNFFLKITSNAKIITLVLSMFPLIELKGAIPVGVGLGLNTVTSAALAYAGSSLVIIPLFFLLIPIFNLLKKIKFIKKLIEKIEGVFERKSEELAKKANGKAEDKRRKILIWGLFVFVAIPLPFTGVWTGTAIAVFLNMKFKDSFLPLVVGNLIAGTIITLLTLAFKDYVNIIIDVVFVIALVMLLTFIFKLWFSKSKKPAEKVTGENAFIKDENGNEGEMKGGEDENA